MKPNWLKLAKSGPENLLPNYNIFKNIFDYTTAGDRDSLAMVERLPAICYCVDFIFLSCGIMDFIVELCNH